MNCQNFSPKIQKFPGIPAGNFWSGGFPGIPEREFPVALYESFDKRLLIFRFMFIFLWSRVYVSVLHFLPSVAVWLTRGSFTLNQFQFQLHASKIVAHKYKDSLWTKIFITSIQNINVSFVEIGTWVCQLYIVQNEA